MYIAELKGKLSSKLENSEDILTSNVFSFLKYAERNVYLKEFLSLIEVDLTQEELESAEFIFWPTYEDGTEPDVVILAGIYYLLFEAKYHAGFSEESEIKAGQIQREYTEGSKEARYSDDKVFKMSIITADSLYPRKEIPEAYREDISWINWQSFSKILLNALEKGDSPNYRFAEDLYDLLAKKRLRGFLAFHRLENTYLFTHEPSIFFSAQSSTFRGDFIGFEKALEIEKRVEKSRNTLFFSKNFFRDLPGLDLIHLNVIFYRS